MMLIILTETVKVITKKEVLEYLDPKSEDYLNKVKVISYIIQEIVSIIMDNINIYYKKVQKCLIKHGLDNEFMYLPVYSIFLINARNDFS